LQTRPGVNFGHGSSVGRVRDSNEDYHRVKTFQTTKGPLVFLAVADGMGGAAAGEYASKIAVDVVTKAISDYVDFVANGNAAIPLEKALEKSIQAANRTIYKTALEFPERDGMGTTLTVLILYERRGILGHVGDSRAHLVRKGQVQQISKDHSWVEEQVEKGILTREQAENHQYRNLLARALGTRPQVAVDVLSFPISTGDTFILTSDGLHNQVRIDEFLDELNRGSALQMALEYFIGLANQRGGPDNITGVLAQVMT
jgi:serine/threonine protein phosphatase PrpC